MYPMVRLFFRNAALEALRLGYVEGTRGRRRYIPEVLSADKRLREAGHRQAGNTLIQGTAAEMTKLAMIKVWKVIGKRSDWFPLLQVHDELITECETSKLRECADLLKQSMETAMELELPFPVEVKVGDNWLDMESFVV